MQKIATLQEALIALTLLLTTCGLLYTSQYASAESMNRGITVWDKFVPNPADPEDFAVSLIATNQNKQARLLNFIRDHGISRTHLGYHPDHLPNPTIQGNFNKKIKSAGADPLYLLGSFEVDHLSRAIYVDIIKNNVVDFNQGRDSDEQYQGVYLDFEPWALPEFSDGGSDAPITRRDLLWDLHQTYSDIRNIMDENGSAGLPLQGFMPAWLDTLEGFIEWGEGTPLSAEQERDFWFDEVSEVLDSVVFAPFSISNINAITDPVSGLVSWEMNREFSGDMDVTIALHADIGSSPEATWPDVDAFWDMIDRVEDHYIGNSLTNPHGHTVGMEIETLSNFTVPEPTTVLMLMACGAGTCMRRHCRRLC